MTSILAPSSAAQTNSLSAFTPAIARGSVGAPSALPVARDHRSPLPARKRHRHDIRQLASAGPVQLSEEFHCRLQAPAHDGSISPRRAPSVSSPTSCPESASTDPASPNSSITPARATACVSPAPIALAVRSRSCSRPWTSSTHLASTLSASRSTSTPRPRLARSCSTSSAEIR